MLFFWLYSFLSSRITAPRLLSQASILMHWVQACKCACALVVCVLVFSVCVQGVVIHGFCLFCFCSTLFWRLIHVAAYTSGPLPPPAVRIPWLHPPPCTYLFPWWRKRLPLLCATTDTITMNISYMSPWRPVRELLWDIIPEQDFWVTGHMQSRDYSPSFRAEKITHRLHT